MSYTLTSSTTHPAPISEMISANVGRSAGNNSAIGNILALLNTTGEFQLYQASGAVKDLLSRDPQSDRALVAAANAGALNTDGVIHLIKVFEVICSKTELLSHLLRIKSPDSRVRSKIRLTVGRLSSNMTWLAGQLADPDPWVRANLVEGLWDIRRDGVEDLLAKAARDSDYRVVSNAAVALYKLGQIEAFQICRSLLVQADPDGRRAGLKAAMEMGDPRFLDFFHNSLPPALDQAELEAREEAKSFLGQCLNMACFTDILTLKLHSVTVDPSGRRKLQIQCFPSDPAIPLTAVDLAAVNFAIEEEGRAIDNFEYRWIDGRETLNFQVIAPERLRFRNQMLHPNPVLTLQENFSLLRFGSLQSTEPELRLPQVFTRAAKLLENESGLKNLILVLDDSYDLSFVEAQITSLEANNVKVHAIANGNLSEKATRLVSNLCTGTGGDLVRSSAAQELEKQLHRIRAQHAGLVELSWKSNVRLPSGISVQCFSSFGYGELMI